VRWRCRDQVWDLEGRVLLMGVLNVTPDSFSDGGLYLEAPAALEHGRHLLAAGADLVDVGAESTRPGAAPVPAAEQWRRLEPVLHGLLAEPRARLSVDTSSAEVAERALALGVHAINDVTALSDPRLAAAVAAAGAGAILMHMRGTPADMQRDPRYQDAPAEVTAWLAARAAAARARGVAEERIALDPGIGFGKTVAHNLELLARLDRLAALGRPVVVGVSRKSFLGKLLDLPVGERLEAGLAASAVAVFQGAAVLRTHDVEATRRAAAVAVALRAARAPAALRPPA
jgi:dihydropteroate synthase